MPAEMEAKRLACDEPDQAHRGGGAVLLVVGVQDEQQVERLDQVGVEVVGLGREAERHPQEVLGQRQRVVRVEERLADALLVGVGRDRRQLGHQAHGRDLDLLLVERVEAVLVEGRQGRHGGGQHRHRVRVAGEAGEEGLEVLVQQRVAADALVELGELVLGRQLAVDEEVGHLEEARLLGQLLDRVAPVAQDALVAVDVGDRARAGGGVDEPDVQGDVARLLEELGDVVPVVPLGGLDQGKGQLAAPSLQSGGRYVVAHQPILKCVCGHPGLARPAQLRRYPR